MDTNPFPVLYQHKHCSLYSLYFVWVMQNRLCILYVAQNVYAKDSHPVLQSKLSIWFCATLLECYQHAANDERMKTSVNERYPLCRQPRGNRADNKRVLLGSQAR